MTNREINFVSFMAEALITAADNEILNKIFDALKVDNPTTEYKSVIRIYKKLQKKLPYGSIAAKISYLNSKSISMRQGTKSELVASETILWALANWKTRWRKRK